MTKYGFDISEKSVATNAMRLTNQMWKLIPMRENEEDWKQQLESVIIQVSGLNEIFMFNPLFLQLLSKLEGLLAEEEVEFQIYRKIIFECIRLLQELKDD